MTVTDPSGQRWPRTAVSARMMSVNLNATAQGVYLVEWRTVSPLDGHTLRGEFRFGVGGSPDDAGDTALDPLLSELLLGVGRAIENGALLLVVGALMVGYVSRRRPVLSWVRVRVIVLVASALALGAGILVVTGEGLIAAPSPSFPGVLAYLQAESGPTRLARLGAELLLLIGAVLGRHLVAATASVAALTALSNSGHAAAVAPRWWGVGAGALHLVAAGVWAGGIGTLALLRPPGGWRRGAARALLRRFSPPAIAGFLATVVFGGLRGFQELAEPGDLLATSYGRVLLVKVGAVALMAPLSWRAWRRRHTAPRLESTFALIAVFAAALLAAYPLPPRRAAEAAAVAEGSSAAFPQDQDLTMGTNTGPVLVGLTLRPGLPGENQALVYVLPPGGEAAAVRLGVELRVEGGEGISLERCGTACRTTSLQVRGGELLELYVGGVAQPATFRLPHLPAAGANDLLELFSTRMGTLRSVRVDEVLGPADPPIRSTLEMVAPDRLRLVIHDSGREQIRVGDALFRRDGPGQPWEVSPGLVIEVPVFVWDYDERVAAHVVAAEEISGTPTQVVAFFVDAGIDLPIWYRLWVDDGGLVHRAEMRAEGHFMDHTYSEFDSPLVIVDPVGGGE